MTIDELKEKVVNAYKIEKYAELSLLLLFLDNENYDLAVLAAKLVLESEHHKDKIENVLKKLNLENRINEKSSKVVETKESLEKLSEMELYKMLVNNEILAMNTYLDIFLTTDPDILKNFFENVNEFFYTFKELSYEELNHAKMLLQFIFKNH